jgi:hypothetical protein
LGLTVFDWLLGRLTSMALGLTSVDMRIKKINSRNTRSDMEAVLNVISFLFLVLIAMCFVY